MCDSKFIEAVNNILQECYTCNDVNKVEKELIKEVKLLCKDWKDIIQIGYLKMDI